MDMTICILAWFIDLSMNCKKLVCWIEIYGMGNVFCLLRWAIGSSMSIRSCYVGIEYVRWKI